MSTTLALPGAGVEIICTSACIPGGTVHTHGAMAAITQLSTQLIIFIFKGLAQFRQANFSVFMLYTPYHVQYQLLVAKP